MWVFQTQQGKGFFFVTILSIQLPAPKYLWDLKLRELRLG